MRENMGNNIFSLTSTLAGYVTGTIENAFKRCGGPAATIEQKRGAEKEVALRSKERSH